MENAFSRQPMIMIWDCCSDVSTVQRPCRRTVKTHPMEGLQFVKGAAMDASPIATMDETSMSSSPVIEFAKSAASRATLVEKFDIEPFPDFQPNEQTLEGSLSSVSTPNFASKYSLESS